MISCSKKEIENLQYIGSGKFGSVYKKDDKTAYKIYHESFYDYYGNVVNNETLKLPESRFKELIKRSKKLKYSTPINDVLFIDGEFKGISIPYYNGKTLNHFVKEPLKTRIEYSKKIIKIAKELNSNLIYPTDYRLNNIIFDNDIHLIDLDDCLTHLSYVPNIYYRSFGINILAETIQLLLNQYDHYTVNKKIWTELGRIKAFSSCSFNKIEKYINDKEKSNDIVFINNLDDLQIILDNPNLFNSQIVYILDNYKIDYKELSYIIDYLKNNNIQLYDFILKEKIESYDNIELINNSYLIENKNVKVLKKSLK